ncbi:hypothetical protein PAESOLCIP111_03777 [Paenibacillus solanacearum]|uniref:Extracellular solute-binding protein n=1 Tax=Paenibacillus solanacearum TaxID=2048548 RepID=A0A916K4B2_9BACL|nr:extracellular solute-binding protein [Paenibacillus solanacearum]CAG7636715.1 hypothetical protein PAESOLCIP111_03777 [Paenibacillus solanacearum]
MVGRKSALALAGLMIVSALSGCAAGSGGSSSGGNGQAVENSGKAELPKSAEPVELVVADGLGDFPLERFNKVFAEPVKKKYPHITLKWIAAGDISKRITAGEPIDLVISSSGLLQARVVDFGLQYDVTPLIKKYNYDLNKVEPAALDMFKKFGNGAVWGIPSFMSPSPLYYNKDVFDKFGVPYPKDGTTWDDLNELSKKLTRLDGNEQYYGLFLSFAHVIRRNQYSLNVVDPATSKAAFNTDAWKSVFEQSGQFYRNPNMNMTTASAALAFQRDAFIKKRSVAMWLPVSTLHTEAELQGMNWDMASFPTYKDKPNVGPQPYPVAFFVTTSSKYKDDAFQVASFMATEEYQMEWVKKGEFLTALKNDTLRKSFGADTALYKGKNIKAMLPDTYAPASALTKYNGAAETIMNSTFTKYILNQTDLNTALRGAEEETNKKIVELQAAEKK